MSPARLFRSLMALLLVLTSFPLTVLPDSSPHYAEAASESRLGRTPALRVGEEQPSAVPDGSLDPTFGDGGKVTADFSAGGYFAYAVALQPDGKFVTVGYAMHDGSWDFAVARFTASGALDTTFGTGGRVTTDFLGSHDWGTAVALQPDGKIVVAGYSHSFGGDYEFAVVRYTASGTLDTTFSSDGKVTTDFSGLDDELRSVAVQPDGKIVAVGSAQIGTASNYQSNFAVVRYTTNGALDSTFGSGGKVTTDFVGKNDFAMAIALQPNGKIVAAGGSVSVGCCLADFAAVRYTANGTLDSTFGVSGRVTTDFFGHHDSVHSLALQSDGKIVAGGVAFSNTGDDEYTDFGMVRYTANGALDSTFGSGGKVTTDFFDYHDFPMAVTVQPDGKIVAAAAQGRSGSNDKEFALMRYTSSGTLDPTFGTDGKITTDFSGGYDFATAVLVQPDGKIVAAGSAGNGSDADFALARYHSVAPGVFQFSAPSYTVVENTDSITITVTRQDGDGSPVGVRATTVGGGSATSGADYTHTSILLSWADGDTAPKTFTIPIANDTLIEPDETIALALSIPTGGASLGTPNTATLTITNDDSPTLGDYGNAVVTDSPAAYWQLDETSGTVAQDSSSNGNIGTYLNGITLNAAGALPDEAGNKAVQFDGTDDYVRAGDSPSLSPAAVSVEAWVNLAAYSASYPRLMSKPGAYELTLYTAAGHEGRLEWKLSLVGGDVLLTTAFADRLLLGQWYHLAATYDGTTMRVFLNGQQKATNAASGAIKDSVAALTIGSHLANRTPAAAFDEVAIYGTALPAARVLAHYEAAVPPAPASPYVTAVTTDSPAGYWRLNEDSGARAEDQTASHNDGTYLNGVTLAESGALTSDSDTAIALDGVNDYVSVPDSASLSPTGAVSVEAWVYLTAYSSSYPRLVSKPGAYELTLYTLPGHEGRLEWKVARTSGDVLVGTPFADRLLLNQWHHVAATYDGAMLRVYVDGSEVASKAAAGTLKDSPAALTLGRPDRAPAAKLDEVAVYPTALSAARVQAHYAAR